MQPAILWTWQLQIGSLPTSSFPCQFILLLYTMADYLYFCTGMTLPPMALKWRTSIHTQNHLIGYCNGHPNGSQSISTLPGQIWWWYLLIHSIRRYAVIDPKKSQPMLQTLLFFCYLFWNSTPKSRLNMMGITIKATSPNLLMGLIISITNCTSTRNKRIGEFLYQVYLWTGMNFAWKGSYSLVMYHHHFFGQLCHRQLSTPQLILSALSILFMTAPAHSLQYWQIVIQIERFGFRATLKKNGVLNHAGHTRNFHLPNTMHCMKKVHQRLSPWCASSQSIWMRCSIPSELRLNTWIVVLGNHKDRVWSKSDKYAPILH